MKWRAGSIFIGSVLASAGVLVACNDGTELEPALATEALPAASTDLATARPTPTVVRSPTATATPTATRGPRALLPNLDPLSPDALYIQNDEVTGVRELRFSTLVANIGEGRLTMHGTLNPDGASSTAVQVIDLEDGSTTEESIGSFTYHQVHLHWHFKDFMIFELWTHGPDGRLDKMLQTSGKLTFCIVDNVPVPEFSHVDQSPLASECGSDVQGISRGWIDIYAADVPGQDLDLADLPDGSYALRTRIDPDGLVRETDDTDNEDVTYIAIQGFEVQIVELPARAQSAQR